VGRKEIILTLTLTYIGGEGIGGIAFSPRSSWMSLLHAAEG
jgi:hypothetical protein